MDMNGQYVPVCIRVILKVITGTAKCMTFIKCGSLIAPGVVVSWNWTGDLRVSASGSSSQMACIVIVKETHGSEPWALEHVIIELDTFTTLFRTSFTGPESMLSAQGSKVALRWSARIRRVPALITGTGTGWVRGFRQPLQTTAGLWNQPYSMPIHLLS